MKWMLRLKHWQLFLMIIGPGILAIILHMYRILTMFTQISTEEFTGDPNPDLIFDRAFGHMPYFMALIFISYLVSILWHWSIGNLLHDKLPVGTNMNLNLFRVAVVATGVGFLVFIGYMLYFFSIMMDFATIAAQAPEPPIQMFAGMFLMFPVQIAVMVATFYIYYFCGRSIKTAEQQRDLTFSDYIGEFFLVWFSFIGIWILQPRLNKLVDKSKEEILGDMGGDPYNAMVG